MKTSVVLASCRATELVAEAIARLLPQCREAGSELIVARSAPVGSPDPDALFTGCTLVPCTAGATIPEIRGAGLGAATGDYVLLTEDNCVPRTDWVQQLMSGFDSGADIVGGTMGNAHPHRPIDAAAYFAEYGFFGESRTEPGAGASPMVTGANVGYRRSVADDAAMWAAHGDWEGVIHHRLVARGARVVLVRNAVVDQNLHYQLGSFCRDRFKHALEYASVRRESWGVGTRVAAAGATLVLPPLLAWRAWQSAGRIDRAGFVRSLPFTLCFFGAWAAGEAAGYLRGRTR
ncbi:MAG: glycosyltransferase [Gemmatimonadales bacterium]|nr:glycosyltransferase [Gemmatimonadales bacterium]